MTTHAPVNATTLRQSIKSKALILFAKRGVLATTPRDVYEFADISKVEFEREFTSCEQILRELIDDFERSSLELVRALTFDKPELRGNLEIYVGFLVSLHLRHDNMFRVMAAQASVDASFMPAMRDTRQKGVDDAARGFGHLICKDPDKARQKIDEMTQVVLATLTHSVVFGSGPIHFRDGLSSKTLTNMAEKLL